MLLYVVNKYWVGYFLRSVYVRSTRNFLKLFKKKEDFLFKPVFEYTVSFVLSKSVFVCETCIFRLIVVYHHRNLIKGSNFIRVFTTKSTQN